MTLHPSTRKQIAALRVAIDSMEETRRGYAVGHAAYQSGMRPDVINSGGVEWTGFAFAEDDYNAYARIDAAIRELEDLVEVLSDEGGAMVTQPSLFEQV